MAEIETDKTHLEREIKIGRITFHCYFFDSQIYVSLESLI